VIKKKKTLIALTLALITSVVFLPRCYDANHATVRIKLTNLPVSYNAPKEHIIDRVLNIFSKKAYAETGYHGNMLYVAAFEGDAPLAVICVNPPKGAMETSVELRVPAGTARKIVALVEREYSSTNQIFITEYGESDPVNLVAGEEHPVSFQMKSMSTALDVKQAELGLPRREWNKITGASSYSIYKDQGSSAPDYEFLVNTTNTHYVPSSGSGNYGLEVNFSFIGKKSSDKVSFYFP
jgi:hypothetical protein